MGDALTMLGVMIVILIPFVVLFCICMLIIHLITGGSLKNTLIYNGILLFLSKVFNSFKKF